jgi:hypothetical protein
VTGGDLTLPLNDILLCLFWGGCLSGLVNWTFIIASRHLATAELTLLTSSRWARSGYGCSSAKSRTAGR